MRTTIARLAAAATLVLALSVPASGLAHGTLRTGKYSCYVFYSPGVPTYTGRYITIKSATKYSYYNGKSVKAGKYSHAASGKLKFKTGPLKGMTGRHRLDPDGTSGVNITFKTSAGPSDFTCSRSSS